MQRVISRRAAVAAAVAGLGVAGLALMPESGQGQGGAASAGRLSASPERGGAPLAVTFSGHGGGASYFGGVWIHFGDGSNASFCPPGLGCRERSISHIYPRAGAYTATLVGVGEGSSRTLGTVTITVGK